MLNGESQSPGTAQRSTAELPVTARHRKPWALATRFKSVLHHGDPFSARPETAIIHGREQDVNGADESEPIENSKGARAVWDRDVPYDGNVMCHSSTVPHASTVSGSAKSRRSYLTARYLQEPSAEHGLDSMPQQTSTFPATRLFGACAELLVTPLGQEFVLDPSKLGSTTAWMTSTNCAFPAHTSTDGLARIVDLGGLDTGMSK